MKDRGVRFPALLIGSGGGSRAKAGKRRHQFADGVVTLAGDASLIDGGNLVGWPSSRADANLDRRRQQAGLHTRIDRRPRIAGGLHHSGNPKNSSHWKVSFRLVTRPNADPVCLLGV